MAQDKLQKPEVVDFELSKIDGSEDEDETVFAALYISRGLHHKAHVLDSFPWWHSFLLIHDVISFAVISKRSLEVCTEVLDVNVRDFGRDRPAINFLRSHAMLSKCKLLNLINPTELSMTDTFVEAIEQAFPSLLFLKIQSLPHMTSKHVSQWTCTLSSHCSRLRSLYIGKCAVKKLDLTGCAHLTSIRLPKAIGLCTLQIHSDISLLELDISHSLLNAAALVFLLQQGKTRYSLSRLSFCASTHLVDTLTLPSMHALTYLNISHCVKLRSITVESHRLKYLHVQQCFALQTLRIVNASVDMHSVDVRMLRHLIELTGVPESCHVMLQGSGMDSEVCNYSDWGE